MTAPIGLTSSLAILVVDDSAYARRTLSRIVESIPGVSLAGVAADGIAALREIKRLRPQLVLLDLEMPQLDGFAVLRAVAEMEGAPSVIVVSAASEAKNVVKALELGALDFIAKPSAEASPELERIRHELEEKIGAVRGGARFPRLSAAGEPTETHGGEKPPPADTPPAALVAVIGSSTGGPGALVEILSAIPRTVPCGIVIAQHMPKGFTAAFAERLGRKCRLAAAEGAEGMVVRRGSIVVGPGGSHLTLARGADGTIRCALTPATSEAWVPSVDRLFVSAASLGKAALGVVLSGMGSDGAAGSLALRAAGAPVFVESAETAAVNGMPASVIAAGAASGIVRRGEVAMAIRGWAERG